MVAAIAVCLSGWGAQAVSLDGTWDLSYRFQQEGGDWKTIPAMVPGDTLIEFEKAGLISDPMIGTNAYGTYWTEQLEWKYVRRFPNIELKSGERAVLRFGGVDTRAEYFLNGERIGASENMFLPVEFDVTGKLLADNELAVRIRSPLRDPTDPLGVLGRTRVGGTDVEGIRKAQHMYGWDIMPRLVSSGIWKSVSLEAVPAIRFADVHWMVRGTDRRARRASLIVDCRILAPWRYLHVAKLRLTLSRNGKVAATVENPVRCYQTRDYMDVSDAELWWPRGTGDSPLYDAVAELIDADGTILARDERKVGLRTVRLERADWHSEEDPGTFRFVINGEPIYMHGVDVSPMDALHSRDGLHRRKCLDMLVDLNCNMIRIWGGGVYEEDSYYDFCDRNGIMVWQDFMMGNVAPEQNDRFAKAIEEEARAVVMRLRSHPCLALWCGNNEQDRSVGGSWGEYAPDPEKDRISREVLPRVLRDFDPLTPYLPSSPWWTPDVVAGKAKLSQDHLWGPRAMFYSNEFWTSNSVSFVSEMGCHGCPNLDSLRRMMTPEGLYPWPDLGNRHHFNIEWEFKSTCAYTEQCPHPWYGDGRNSLMPKQVKLVFGAVPDDLETFVEMSQTYQAMCNKYYIELYRSRKGRMWGELIWNLRDGWPILSDGIVDYWYGKKKTYGAIKSVHQPQLVTVVAEKPRLVAVNDRLYPVRGRVTATDCESGKAIFDGETEIPANGTKVLSEELGLPAANGCVRITYEFEGEVRENRCIYGQPPFDFNKVREWLK